MKNQPEENKNTRSNFDVVQPEFPTTQEPKTSLTEAHPREVDSPQLSDQIRDAKRMWDEFQTGSGYENYANDLISLLEEAIKDKAYAPLGLDGFAVALYRGPDGVIKIDIDTSEVTDPNDMQSGKGEGCPKFELIINDADYRPCPDGSDGWQHLRMSINTGQHEWEDC